MTKDQKEAIRSGYTTLVRLLETDHTMSDRLDKAFSLDRRDRGGAQELTMSVLCEAFLDGYEKDWNAGRAYGYALGAGIIFTIGAYFRSRHSSYERERYTIREYQRESLRRAANARLEPVRA